MYDIFRFDIVDFQMTFIMTVRNLMYGFGDDRNPSNDSVNVLEEILVEYIVDVVRDVSPALPTLRQLFLSVSDSPFSRKEIKTIHRRPT